MDRRRLPAARLWPILLAAPLAVAGMLAYAEVLHRLGLVPGAHKLMLAVFLAAIVASMAGFAFSALCGAALFHLPYDHVQVVQTLMLCSIAIQALALSVLFRSIEWRLLPPFLAGGLIGLPIGLGVLLLADRDSFGMTVGAMLSTYAAAMLLRRRPIVLHASRWRDLLAGLLGGITGGAAAFPGGPVTVWCQMRGWPHQRQRGVFQPFILAMQLLALAFLALGLSPGAPSLPGPLAWAAVPVALAGALLGLRAYGTMNDAQFRTAANLLLLVSGVALLL